MKYKDPITGELRDVVIKSGDTLPIGTIVEFDGDTIPDGYEEFETQDYGSLGNIIVDDVICKNMLDENLLIKGLISIGSGAYNPNPDACCINNFIEIDNTKNYTFSWSFSANANAYVIFFDKDKNVLGNIYQQASKYSLKLNTFEKYSSVKYIKFRFDTLITNKIYLQLELGDTFTGYVRHKSFENNVIYGTFTDSVTASLASGTATRIDSDIPYDDNYTYFANADIAEYYNGWIVCTRVFNKDGYISFTLYNLGSGEATGTITVKYFGIRK